MHYVDEGSGPVVICVHGNPTWSFYYRDLIKKLSPNFRVIALDHIGCGLSEHPKNKHFKAKERARHLELLIKHLGLTSYSFVMHDWGGSIATFAAISNIDAVEKLIYFNTTLTETETLPWFIKLSTPAFPGKFITKFTKTFLRLATEVGVCKKLPKKVKQGYMYPYRTISDRTAIWDFVQDIPFNTDHPTYLGMMDISRALPALNKKPIQIIWGLKDPCFHPEMLTHLMRLFPNANVVELPNASHLVLEDETELITEKIESFLKAKVSPKQKVDTAPDLVMEDPKTMYEHFIKEVNTRPHQAAAIIPKIWGSNISYKHITYSDLGSLVARYHRGLTTLGLRQGDKVLFLVTPGIDFLALAYAVMAEGAIPVFIDPGIDKNYLFQALADIKADVFIGTQKAHFLRLLKKNLFSNLRFHIIANEWGVTGGPTLSVLRRFASTPQLPVKNNEVAMVAFTSGATGVPKGVIFTQAMVKAQLKVFREQFGILPGEKDLPLLPIFSIFQVANGVTSVIAPLNPSEPLALDPSIISRIIKDLSISYSFGSPTLWKKIAEYCVRVRTTLPTLKRVFMAGAAVPQSTVAVVNEILDSGEAFTPYGATEALPVTLIDSSQLLNKRSQFAKSGEEGTFVGEPIDGVELKIISEVDGQIKDITDVRYLETLNIGEIIVRGPTVSPGYLNRKDADELGKITDGDTFWHRMGDMGYVDESGGLYYCGRKSHVVRSGNRSFHSVPIEEIFNAHPSVARSALVEVEKGEPGIVIEPLANLWTEDNSAQEKLINEMRSVAANSSLTKEITKFFVNQSFPVDRRHNAKIYRDKLGVWAREIEKSTRQKQGRNQGRYGNS